jgi:hypothetical protein
MFFRLLIDADLGCASYVLRVDGGVADVLAALARQPVTRLPRVDVRGSPVCLDSPA